MWRGFRRRDGRKIDDVASVMCADVAKMLLWAFINMKVSGTGL